MPPAASWPRCCAHQTHTGGSSENEFVDGVRVAAGRIRGRSSSKKQPGGEARKEFCSQDRQRIRGDGKSMLPPLGSPWMISRFLSLSPSCYIVFLWRRSCGASKFSSHAATVLDLSSSRGTGTAQLVLLIWKGRKSRRGGRSRAGDLYRLMTRQKRKRENAANPAGIKLTVGTHPRQT